MKASQPVLSWCAALCLLSPAHAQEQPASPPPAPAQTGPDTHMVRDGDTLWDLSGRYMGSSYEWPRLWSYNPEITNPHWIYPGNVLRLREGADVGAAVAGGPPGAGGPGEGGLGSGFGAMFNKRGGRGNGSVLIGEEVYLDKDALAQAGVIAGSPEEQMLLAPTDQVYLKFNKDVTPTQGKEMTVFVRLHRKEVSPRAGKVRAYDPGEKGEVVRVLGAVRVETFDEKNRIARATILAARDPIERGFEVTDVPSRLMDVPAKTNQRKVEARVVASNRPLGVLGQGQLVFVDAGTEQGVQVGNRFFVVRRGDDWRQHLTLREDMSGAERPDPDPEKDENYPWEVVAEARVLYVRAQSSTALITQSLSEVEPGDRVEMREGY